MAQTTPISGKVFRISAATTQAGTYSIVKGMTGYDKTGTVQTESTATFDAAVAFSDPGTPELSYSLNGLLIPDDPGQIIIRNAAASQATIWIKVLPMGGDANATENVRGFTHGVKVGTTRHNAQAGPGAQGWGFDLLSQEDPAVTVGGYII